MRKSQPLDALFPTIRQGILAVTLLHPDRWWYLSALAQHLRVTPSSLQRELAALVEAGILQRRRDGNRTYYRPDPTCPFLPELQGLLTKTVGLADILKAVLEPFWERVDFAFVYGSMARNEETASSDVDLMLIGTLRLAEIAPALREAERQMQRSVNPTVFTRPEFAMKIAAGHHFLNTVLRSDKIFLKGSEYELGEALSRAQSEAAHHELARTH